MLREGREKNRESGGALQGRLPGEEKDFIQVWWKGAAMDWLERMAQGLSQGGELSQPRRAHVAMQARLQVTLALQRGWSGQGVEVHLP